MLHLDITKHREGDKCPACNAYDKPKGGVLIRKSTGWTIRCHRYPDCRFECIHKTSRRNRVGRKSKAKDHQFGRKAIANYEKLLIQRDSAERKRAEEVFKERISI